MRHIGRVLVVASAVLIANACGQCGDKPKDDPRDGLLVPPTEKQPLELSPLPQPPAVQIAPGAIAGIPAGPVTVVVARPQGEIRGRELPSITFNKPLVSLGDRDATKPPAIRIEPAIAGEWRWVGSSSVDFLPAKDLPWATKFTITVDAGLAAIDGEKLAAPYSFSFATAHPLLTSSKPSDGWGWLAPDAKIQLYFNMPVAGAGFTEHVKITSNGKPVSYSVANVVDEAAEEAKKRGSKPPERTPWGQRMRYELQLAGALEKGATVVVTLDDALAAEEGSLTSDAKTLTFKVAGDFTWKSVRACPTWRESCPYGPVMLFASNEPDLESMKGKVTFDPPAVLDDDDAASGVNVEDGGWAQLGGRFRAGTKYTVKVAAGVKDALGQSAPAFTGTFELDDVDADVKVPTSLALIEGGGDDAYPVEAVNVPHVNASITALTPSQLARMLADHRVGPPSGTVQRVVNTGTARNVAVRKPLALGEVLANDAAPGKLFHLGLQAPGVNDGKPQVVIGQITDVAAHAKLGASSGVVWVTSVSKGTPIAGAEVKLYSGDSGDEVARATTDADGIAKVPGLAGLAGMPPFDGGGWSAPEVLVSAQKGDDLGVTWSVWEGEIGPGYANVDIDWEGDRTRTLGVLVADRGIYRPGDEVFLKGIVRLRKRGTISLPKADSEMEITIEARGKQIAKERVPVTKFGTFSTKLKLPADGSLGWHSVQARADVNGERITLDTSLRVEEYKAPTFKVDVKTASPHAIAGDAVSARVEARYLFGGAMPGAAVETSIVRDAEYWSPEGPGLERYAFGSHTWGYDDGEPTASSDVLARQRGVVAGDGGFAIEGIVAEPLAGRTTRYTVEAEVADVSRRRVANRATMLVHPASAYVGVRVDGAGGFGEVGKPMRIELVAADIEGQRVSGIPVTVTVKRREWKSIKKKDPDSGRFVTLSEPEEIAVTTCNASTDSSSLARCELVPDKAGLYLINATATDLKGRKQTTKISTYVTGGGWVSWQRSEGQLLELIADQKMYEPGQTAKVLVKSPWPEAEALVTVEREGVSSVRRVKLVGAATALDIPLDDATIPNVFVSVLVVRGRLADAQATAEEKAEIDPGRPQVRAGYVNLTVAKAKKKLAVEIDTGPNPRRPGEKIKVKIVVKDFAGQGTAAEVALWAVDEAVLRLTDYSVPDPVDALHPARGLSVRLGEPLVFLVRRQGYGEKGRPPGGDGGDSGGGFRSNFKTTAFFVPEIVTDANGRAEVEVKLPDDLTTYRVMALAVTADERAGSGRTDMTVAKPLLALPALPRLARAGDTFEAGVIVHAQKSGDVKVTAELEGLTLIGPATKTISVAAGKAQEVRFAMKGEQAGIARLRFKVEGGGESDGLEQKIPVVIPTVMETVAAAGDTVDSRTEGLVPPEGARSDVGGLDVTLASTALAGYQDALEQLVEYPYGCAEQLSSRLVPFIAVRELEGGFGITHKGGADDQARLAAWLGFNDKMVLQPDEVVKKTIRALEALQDRDGGFLYWGSSGCANPSASAYATLALYRAQELGYPVTPGVVARAQSFLSDKVAADKLPTCGWSHTGHVAPVERTFAAWVLARTGKPKNSVLEPLFQQRKELPLFAKAMLVDAHFVGKDKQATVAGGRAQTLLQEVMNGARETAREVHFEETDPGRWSWYWSSDLRSSAIVLMMLVDAQPDHPFVNKIAQYLKTAKKNGRYRNTQEAAFALMAVSELVRAKEREAPDFVATVTFAEQPLVSEDFRGRNMDAFTKTVPMSELAGKAGGKLVFAKKGDGTLSYTATLRYAKKDMPTTPVDAGIAVQRWIEPFSAPAGSGQARKVRAGELVRVRVRVASPTERRFVAISVPMPAGLELIDDSLASSASAGRAAGGGGGEGGEGDEGEYEGEGGDGEYGDEGDGYEEPYVWSPFNHTELRDDRAVFFSDVLPPGAHTATVIARATTLGSFVLMPATAEEMYAPEVSGRSDGGSFEVVAE